jgi:hypothetical protein
VNEKGKEIAGKIGRLRNKVLIIREAMNKMSQVLDDTGNQIDALNEALRSQIENFIEVLGENDSHEETESSKEEEVCENCIYWKHDQDEFGICRLACSVEDSDSITQEDETCSGFKPKSKFKKQCLFYIEGGICKLDENIDINEPKHDCDDCAEFQPKDSNQ